jgi:hypothetical protein
MSTTEELPPQHSARPWQALTIVALIVAIGAVVVALVALNKKAPNAAHVAGAVTFTAFNRLEGEVSALRSQLLAAEATAKTSSTMVTSDHATASKLTTCVPELDALINGQNVETGYQEVGTTRYLTSAYLGSHAQPSTYCTSTLTKASGAP